MAVGAGLQMQKQDVRVAGNTLVQAAHLAVDHMRCVRVIARLQLEVTHKAHDLVGVAAAERAAQAQVAWLPECVVRWMI
jgi:hypothetical protein